jgi:hypothetical protein
MKMGKLLSNMWERLLYLQLGCVKNKQNILEWDVENFLLTRKIAHKNLYIIKKLLQMHFKLQGAKILLLCYFEIYSLKKEAYW